MKLFSKIIVWYCCQVTLVLCSADYAWPSFDNAMASYTSYRKEICNRDAHWNCVKRLYNQAFMPMNYSETPRIPKKIHHIWLGSPLPEKYQHLREIFMEMHPGWEFYLWTEKEVDEFGLKNRAMYDATTNFGEKSDIARYEILYRFGGVYFDTDFECLKPFDALHHCCDFYTGFVTDKNATSVCIQNGLIGSVAGHPILKHCIETMCRKPGEGDMSWEIITRTGPVLLQKAFFQYAGRSNLIEVALPPNFFYSWPFFDRENNAPAYIKKCIRPESLAVHLWHVSWNKDATT